MSFQQYNIYPGLTPVRLVSTANIAGTYYNGPANNGVGALLTIAASSLTIDSVAAAVGDRVLLQTQTNTNEVGIYVVNSIGSTVVLQRSADMQSIEQLRAGQFVSVGAGSVNAGNMYSIVEPLPAILGIDALVFNADPSAGGVSFSGPASAANALAVFADTAGNLKAQSVASTLGFGLTISTGNLAVSAGLITGADATASATPGTIRAIKGVMTGSNAIMTSGNLVGVRGEVDLVGASGGFVYGVQGKVIPTGTLSGSIWAPAVFGQYDLSGATLNAGQIAAVWGDMGASGGTFTDVTGARMFAGTNTIASLTLNSMIYLYGKSSNLFELSGSSSTYISTGGATASGTIKQIAITIDGVQYYLQAATVYS